MILYLIRHGQSTGNALALLYGSSDFPLTEAGRAQAMEVREKFPVSDIVRCYSSPLLRAYETAEICFDGTDIPIVCCPQLSEQDMGELEGMNFSELLEKQPEVMNSIMTDWTAFSPPGGETFYAVWQRVIACLEGILSRGENCAITAHNGPLSMITAYLLGSDPKNAARFYFRHGCYSAIDIPDTENGLGGTLLCFNK